MKTFLVNVQKRVPPFLYLRDKLVLSNNERERYQHYRYKRQSGSSANHYTGNGRFEGYIMELLKRIGDVIRGIDFDYKVELVPDGKFGAPGDYSKIWNGMVGEVVRGKADVAAGPLTMTDSRKQAVDFTYPYMSSAIQALILHPDEVQPNPFRIMYPFTIEVWFLNLFIFVLVSVMLFVFNRLDPYDWKATAEKGKTDEASADNFSLKNSLWFCASTLFLQSYDSSPRSNAGRCITGFWWLFVLVMAFSYLTNLNFFITTNQRILYIKDTNDLLAQQEVTFGTIRGGNTYHYLKGHKRDLWHKMNNDHTDVYVKDWREGVERVKSSNGKYAFIGERPELTWIAKQKPCRLLVAGEYLARTQYAFAVAKGSPLADHISSALEILRDNGVMNDLERDYWHLDDRNNYCRNLTQFERSGAFSMKANDLSGAYYILVIGIVASVLIFLGEYLYWYVCGGNKNHGGGGGGGGGGGDKQTQKQMKPYSDFGRDDVGIDGGKGGGGNPNMWI